jgi:hypothetical protein
MVKIMTQSSRKVKGKSYCKEGVLGKGKNTQGATFKIGLKPTHRVALPVVHLAVVSMAAVSQESPKHLAKPFPEPKHIMLSYYEVRHKEYAKIRENVYIMM